MSDQQFPPTKDLGTTDCSDSPADVMSAAPRVLVVDDDPGIQLLMRETLAEAGFVVAVAASGPEAIEQCPAFVPDLVLLDINMPFMDGITACIEIRKQDERNFPIIMVTSVDDAVSIQRAFDAGATDFILKPVNWPLFQRRLDAVLAEWHSSQELDESNRRVRMLEKVAPEQVMLVSRSGVIIEDLKDRPEVMRTDTEKPYPRLEDLFGVDIAQRFRQRISGVLKTRRHNNLEFAVTEQGVNRDYQAQFLVDGRDRVIIVIQDVSPDKESQSAIYDLAYYDSTTGLPNRHLFERCAEEILVDAGLHDRSLVFVSLSFDDISQHDLDDRETMMSVAARLRECLADCSAALQLDKTDGAARVSCIGENRFAFMLDNIQSRNDATAICDRLLQDFARCFDSESGSIKIAPRLGVAAYPTDGRDMQTVLHAAQSAMHEARETGKGVCFSSQAAALQSLETLDYGSELRQAMENRELELHFQPRLSMTGGTVTCVEALLRWNHPMRGFVNLRELLHLAKATGLIVELGDWVLRTACEEARRWQCTPVPRVSVNLSQQEFVRQDLADRVIEVLDRTGLDPGRIDLELTEAALLRTENSVGELERLKSLGVGLVLDDFGTGHTSLAYLKKYPIDALKIDSSFVRNVPGNAEDAAVCEVIITMAHKLGMKAVAEGVETKAQLDFLREQGCDEFQGFHICKPLPAAEIEEYLSQSIGKSE